MRRDRRPITLLLADDDEEDLLLTKEALEQSRLGNDLRFVYDGEELMDYLLRRGRYADPADSPAPGLILLDLNMPRKDGREALTEIKANPDIRRIPVVVLTTSRAEQDILETYDLHANCYIVKPVGLDEFITIVRSVEDFWLSIVRMPPK